MAAPALVEMEGVVKHYATPRGPIEVLRGVNLQIRAGDFVAITGPSGSGKSTLLNLVALLDVPTGGRFRLDGVDVSGLDESGLCDLRKHKIGMVFQKFCLLTYRSVMENVMFRFRYISPVPSHARERAKAMIAEMGLGDRIHQPVRLLSGGEMQRTAIARAVVEPPRLLVADEPTGNLDRKSSDGVMECFKRLNEEGITILLVTHNETLLEYCTRHFICRDGLLAEAPL